MSFAEYYSLFQIAPDKYSIHPYSPRSEILRFLKTRDDIDVTIIGGGVLALALAHQCVLNDLSVVVLEANDYGCGRSQIPIWSSVEWFSSEHVKPMPRVLGNISDSPHERFASRIFMSSDSEIKEGYVHKSSSLVFDLLRAAKSEGAFALNYLKVETTYRLGDRLTVKIFDGLTQERFDIKSRLVVNATPYRKIGPHQKIHTQFIQVYKETYPLPFLALKDEGITLIPDGEGLVFCISELNISKKVLEIFSLHENISEFSSPIWGNKIDSPGTLMGGILTLPQGGQIPHIVQASVETIGGALKMEKVSFYNRSMPSKDKIYKDRQNLFMQNDAIDMDFLRTFIEAEQIYSLDGFLKREPHASETVKDKVRSFF